MKQFIITIAIAFTCFCYGQTCTYTFLGELSDFHDGTPIASATVFIKEHNKYIVSDSNGKFKIENLCSGTLTLKISHIGCETKTMSYIIEGDTYAAIKLEHHIEELDQISVTGNTSKQKTKTAQETVLKANTLKKYSALNLGDALKEVAGVSSINTGNAIVKPMINGMHSSRLLILNNNVRLQDQEWGIEHAPNIDINSADQISVIKGSGALAFGGDAIGGVIVVNPTRIIRKDTLYGRTIIGGQSNGRGYNMSSTLNKSYRSGWFANIQGSLKQNGDFKAPDYNLTNSGLKSHAFTVSAGKKKFESGFEVFYSYLDNEIGILGASHIGSIFDFDRAINSGQPLTIKDFSYDINAPKQDITHHISKVNYYKRFQNFGKVNLQYDYQNNQRFEFDVRRGELRVVPAIDLTLQTHSLLADVNLDANLDRKIDFGIMGRFQDNFANPDTGVRRLIPDYEKYDFGAYTTAEFQVNDGLIIDAGLRYDFNRIDAKKFYLKSRWEERGYDADFSNIIIEELPTQLLTNPVFDFHNISASAGIKYTINESNQIILNYGLASRPPNVSELFSDGLHHSAARYEIGDLRFNKEIANRVSASYAYNVSKFNLLAEVFYNRIEDFIYLRPFGDIKTNRGPFPLWQYKQTNAQLFGMDLTTTYNITDALLWQNKTAFIKGYDLKTNLPLIDIPSFNTTNQITYSNEAWYNFLVSLKSEWSFEQNEFPDFNFEIEDPLTGEMILIEISTPPSAYHLLHLYSEALFSLTEKTNIKIALSINNIFNTSHRNYLNRLRYFAEDLGRNITLQLELNY